LLRAAPQQPKKVRKKTKTPRAIIIDGSVGANRCIETNANIPIPATTSDITKKAMLIISKARLKGVAHVVNTRFFFVE